MSEKTRKGLLGLLSIVLLATGGTMLYRQWASSPAMPADGGEQLNVRHAPEAPAGAQGRFPAQSVERYTFSQDGKDLFDLLLARYLDNEGKTQGAVLFPKDMREIASTPTGLRHEVWQSAADVIARKAPEDALFLSWWDDGQRIRYLSGKEPWLQRPARQTFVNPVWKALKDNLPAASAEEGARLEQMARWLTMDGDTALAEIAAHFGASRPVYLLVNNDLLLHLAELSAYGGAPLALDSKNIPAGSDLHGDIAQVKRWAQETGDGNYLAQKEGNYYRVWSTPDAKAKNALLVRLLPFVDSLKQMPAGVSLVYQSHWGGFLSIYKVDHRQCVNACNRGE
ncbi:hydroxylamine oxidation protein HaoB [Methylomicrobium lacus]|uniref:hydroxylamine oxidation protein HaoB n=1 Tax=Methylomicrobium lacus TaxID=136992 RepID=UPI0035A963B9